MATSAVSFFAVSLPVSRNCFEKPDQSSLSLPLSPFHGNKLLIKGFNSRNFILRRHRSAVSTALPSLPTEKHRAVNVPRWSSRAIRSFAFGELEAKKLRYPNTGTEALLMGILVEGTSSAAKFLRDNGITFFKINDETVNLVGKSEYFYPAKERPPLTEQAQRALDWAIDEKLKSGDDGYITPTHIVLGIWSDTESAGQKILAKLGFNDVKAKQLSQFMNIDADL